jgi:hypothetical protein
VQLQCPYSTDVYGFPTSLSVLSSCPGTLGSPAEYYDADDNVRLAAILVSSDATWTNGQSSAGFAGNSPGGTAWGFVLKTLIAALP